MQTFIDSQSPRGQLTLAQLPRGIVKFPSHIVDAIAKERARFPAEVYTDAYARESLVRHTLAWYYAGLPVAYRSLPDGIEVLGVGWEEADEKSSADPAIKVVQA